MAHPDPLDHAQICTVVESLDHAQQMLSEMIKVSDGSLSPKSLSHISSTFLYASTYQRENARSFVLPDGTVLDTGPNICHTVGLALHSFHRFGNMSEASSQTEQHGNWRGCVLHPPDDVKGMGRSLRRCRRMGRYGGRSRRLFRWFGKTQ